MNRSGHLFAKRADISDVVLHVRESLKRELEALPSERILHGSEDELVAQLVQEYGLRVPTLRRDAIQQLPNQEVDVDVSSDPTRHFMSRGPHYVKGTAVRIVVPFDGDPALFEYPSSSFGVPIEGEVTPEGIVLTFCAERLDPSAAKKDFDSRLNQKLSRPSSSSAARQRNGTGSFHN
jgi:hypothetical protein